MDAFRYRERSFGPNLYRTFTVARGSHYDLNVLNGFVDEVEAWCEDQFPHPRGDGTRGKARYRRLGWSIRIMGDTDALAFKMRWC